ncbi:hypothetical protein JK361_07565 [Streptomyces sp. 5-8]|uniref:Uncharacterized protein n=1 Tax=Streptomyces musisoli TaxID=2802280 RepID=A0ABS1NWG6_9ACTN|nr:SAVMC3_10250 family protein [Streptomyces musisoli]MBL1104457.1 hypothetical protein [Streptomyces musisoli]
MATTSRPPRSYLYISDSKVLSMFNQMPRRRLRKAFKEVKFDLKLFGASLAEPADTRESRLAAVEDFLESAGMVGTLEAPSTYFRGVMSMRWSPLPQPHGAIVYFGGENEHSIIGLSGSIHHVLSSSTNVGPGQPPPQSSVSDTGIGPAFIGGSAAPALTSALETIAEIELDGLSTAQAAIDHHHRAVLAVNAKLKGPVFVAEFLAKRFTTTGILATPASLMGALTGHHDPVMAMRRRGKNVVLGTPVYVAQLN